MRAFGTLSPLFPVLLAVGLSPSVARAETPAWLEVVDLKISGYVQPEVVFSQLSEDEVGPNGGPLNLDRFQVRRARLNIDRHFRYAHVGFELEANTVGGPNVSVNGVDASVFLPNADAGRPPYVALTAGLFDIPFGFEGAQDAGELVFTERTLGSRAFFPSDSDLGVQLSGGLGPFRYAVAAQNGVPFEDEPDAANEVYQADKTLVGRLGVEAKGKLEVGGGVSFLAGTGFHAGTEATKSALSWSDTNQDGLVTLNELVSLNGQAATPSETFERWAVAADVQVGFRTPLGWSRVYAEATMATNLDRGYLVSDPVSAGYDVRGFAWNVSAVQEVTPYGLVGFRADQYAPDSDVFEARRGTFVPTDVSVLTLSPLVGGQLPGLGKLVLQYDYIVDLLGRDDLGQPVDRANDQWTLRAQVEF
jgi:hypothetical protein